MGGNGIASTSAQLNTGMAHVPYDTEFIGLNNVTNLTYASSKNSRVKLPPYEKECIVANLLGQGDAMCIYADRQKPNPLSDDMKLTSAIREAVVVSGNDERVTVPTAYSFHLLQHKKNSKTFLIRYTDKEDPTGWCLGTYVSTDNTANHLDRMPVIWTRCDDAKNSSNMWWSFIEAPVPSIEIDFKGTTSNMVPAS